MPLASKRPCRRCQVATSPGPYCDGCLATGAGKETRRNSTQRGYGYRWQKASTAYLRAHPLAVDYFQTHNGVIYAAEVVDHIIPHRGNMQLFWEPTNWQGLTKVDHDRKTATEDGGFGR